MPIKPDSRAAALFRAVLPPRWLLLGLAAVAVAAAAAGAVAGYLLNRDMPDVRALEDYQPPTISQILAADRRVVHQFAEQKRLVVPLERIDPKLIDAVIAVEDSNFRRHVGVDPTAIARALLRDIREGRWEEGGSTLTQQLTKILFLTPRKTIRRKVQEAILAVQIEKTYTKEEILAFYLNQIYMGHGRYGVEAAAQYYFGRSAEDLDLPEAALLAGLIQRPETYSPVRSPDRARARRNKVLDRMALERFITAEEADEARESPVTVVPVAADGSIAPYFAEEIRKTLSARYGDEALLREGLVISTGLDLDLQIAANAALSRGLRDLDKRRGFRPPRSSAPITKESGFAEYRHPSWERAPRPGDLVVGLITEVTSKRAAVRVGDRTGAIGPEDAAWTGRKDLTQLLKPGDLTLFEVRAILEEELQLALDQEPEVEGALLALDPRTGDIRAMVGGFDFNRSQFNRAHQALRQAGSAFKPFIYAAAIEDGRSPSDLLFDEPTVYVGASGDWYQPENYERRYHGVVTLRRALEESINIPTVTLLNQIGYRRTVEFAQRFGITSRLYPYPSLALGSSEVSLMELTAAYGVFPTGGLHSKPRYFSEVLDRDGNVLEEVKIDSREILDADVAAVMVSMMQGVVRRGTASAASRLGPSLAGKTGTTDDYTDAWFIGYSPSLVVGVWVGHDRKMTLGRGETGARAALPIWMSVMATHLAAHPNEEFRPAAGVVSLPVHYETGMRVAPELACDLVIMETFIKGTEVERPCTSNAHFRLQLPYYLQRYPILAGSRVEIPEQEIERLLLENPFDLDLLGRTSLNVLTPGGARLVPLAYGGPGTEVPWDLIAASADGSESNGGEILHAQLLPSTLPPIDRSLHPFVGLDGRAAAIVQITSP